MQSIEELVLHHLAREGFCSMADLHALILTRATDLEEDSELLVVRLLTEWEDRGWVDTAEMDPAGLVSITDKAFADLPWLARSV
jgi:hypothetical protein